MASSQNDPCMPSDPDIAGIGVRVSIYLQPILNIVSIIVFSIRGDIRKNEPVGFLKNTYKTIFITTLAIIATAAIQETTVGLDMYHALIILDLTWINFFNALLTFVVLCQIVGDNKRDAMGTGVFSFLTVGWIYVFGSAFGLSVWRNVASWGNATQRQCTPQMVLAIFGRSFPVTSPGLRAASIVFYTLSILPIFPILIFAIIFISVAFFLGICIGISGLSRQTVQTEAEIPSTSTTHPDTTTESEEVIQPTPSASDSDSWYPCVSALSMLILEAVLITDIELTIRRNAHLVDPGETRWTFGQMLSMILLIGPLMDFLAVLSKLSLTASLERMRSKEASPDEDPLPESGMQLFHLWITKYNEKQDQRHRRSSGNDKPVDNDSKAQLVEVNVQLVNEV